MGETVRLKIVGMGGKVFHTAPVERVIPEAVELCGRGYTVCLSTASQPGVVLELRRIHHDDEHVLAVVRPEGAVPLPWVQIAQNLIRTTPLTRRP